MDFEKELELLSHRYQNEGYAVIRHPDADHLPPFAKDFGVDLMATRGDERVLIQVKHDRSALEADPNVPMQAGITNAHPGWRYDLIILNEGDPLRRITRDAREPSTEEIDEQLAYVEKLVHAGDFRAACVFAWATLEAAMRHVASEIELYMPRKSPMELLRTMYGNGVLTKEHFDFLNRSFRVRTEIVHGMVPPAVDAGLVRGIVAATRYLLTGNPDNQKVAT